MEFTAQHIVLASAAFLACAVLHQAARHVFPKLGLLDFPERYGLTRDRLPYPTGTLAVVTFLGFYWALTDVNKQTVGISLGIIVLAVTAFIDDRRRLSALARLGVQFLVAFIIFALGTRIYTITNPLVANGIIKLDTLVIPFALFSDPPLLSGLFTIVWLGFTTNALNWFDGIPGQVSLLSVIGFQTIGFLAISERVGHLNPELQLQLGYIAFVLSGISLACFLFDFPPNHVLMGDTGAMFFGLMLGVLTIYAGGKVATAFLVLGVPLIDSFIVVLRRIQKGVSPLRGNAKDEHLHHRLLQKGWTERQVIYLTASLGTGFGVSALFLSTKGKFVAAMVMFLVMLGLSWYSEDRTTK